MKHSNFVGQKSIPATIKDIILSDVGGTLVTELVLVLREKTINGICSWFTGVRNTSRNVKIVQCTSESSSDIIFSRETASWNFMEKNIPEARTQVLDLYAILRSQYQNLDFKKSDLGAFLTKNQGKIKHYEIPVRVKFSYESSHPSFLEYYIIPESVTGGPVSRESVFRESVILNGRVLESGLAYYTNQNILWAGNVHQDPETNSFYGNASRTLPLYTRAVNNTKVKDFRTATRADNVEMRVPKEELDDRYRQKKSYFSDALVSRTLENECSFIFSMDYADLFESLATMKNFIDPTSRVAFGVDVRRIKILRRKLKTNSRVSESRDNTPVEETILEFKPRGARPLGGQNRGAYAREVTGLSFNRAGLKTFQVIDREMSSIKEGVYQYGIEFVYVDDSVDKLLGLKKILDENINKIKPFLYSTCQKVSRSTGGTPDEYMNKYSDDDDIEKAISDYASILEFFKNAPDFSEMSRFLVASTSVHTGTPEGRLSFGNSMRALSEKINKIVLEKSTGTKGLMNTSTKESNISHRTSKESSVKYYFSVAYDASTPRDVGYDFLSTELTEGRKPITKKITASSLVKRGRLETKKFYKDSIRKDDLFSRIFEDSDGPGGRIIDAEVTHLTPAYVLYGSGKTFDNISMDVSKPPGSLYNNFIVDLISRRFNSFSSLASGLSTHKKLGNLFGARNVIIVSRDAGAEEEPVGSCGVLRDDQRIFNMRRLDSSIDRNFDAFEEEKIDLAEMEENKNLFLFSVMAIENLNVLGASINRFDTRTTRVDKRTLTTLPNQLKSLFYVNAVSPLARIPQNMAKSQPLRDLDTFGFTYLNYKNIVSIEYLESLESDGLGRPMLRGQRWKSLTTDKLTSSVKGKLLCRISRADTSGFHMRAPGLLDLPIYNEYFVVELGPTEKRTGGNITADNRRIVKKMMKQNVVDGAVIPCDMIHLRGR